MSYKLSKWLGREFATRHKLTCDDYAIAASPLAITYDVWMLSASMQASFTLEMTFL